MSKITKKQWFIGIDISMDTIDVAYLQEKFPETFKEKQFKNNLQGFDAMLDWMIRRKVNIDESLFCMEHTGTHGLLLFVWLNQKGIDYCVESGLQIKRSLGLVRGKNDQVDARRIASYAHMQKSRIKLYTIPAKNLIQIKQLLAYRDQLVRIQTGLKNSLKSHKQYHQVTKLDFVINDIQQQIKQLTDRTDQLESQIFQIIQTDPQLKKNFEMATSVVGIGPIIAAFILVTTNNFSSFENGRKYACFAGIAPFEESSGKYRGRAHVSHLANKKMKSLFSNGANSARNWDPEMKKYYERKVKEGKAHNAIMTAISCKLVNRVFAVVNRQSPYVKLYQNNFTSYVERS
jgi:transposase